MHMHTCSITDNSIRILVLSLARMHIQYIKLSTLPTISHKHTSKYFQLANKNTLFGIVRSTKCFHRSSRARHTLSPADSLGFRTGAMKRIVIGCQILYITFTRRTPFSKHQACSDAGVPTQYWIYVFLHVGVATGSHIECCFDSKKLIFESGMCHSNLADGN